MSRQNAVNSTAAEEAARLMSQAGKASLATLERGTGHPYVSLVTVALDCEGRPLMLLSALARHTRNLEADGRASLLFEPTSLASGDPLAGGRVTVVGRVDMVDPADPSFDDVRARFLAHNPEAEGYAGFSDFRFYRLEIVTAHFIGGFGRIVEVSASELKDSFA